MGAESLESLENRAIGQSDVETANMSDCFGPISGCSWPGVVFVCTAQVTVCNGSARRDRGDEDPQNGLLGVPPLISARFNAPFAHLAPCLFGGRLL